MEDDSFSPLQTPGLQASVNQELQEKNLSGASLGEEEKARGEEPAFCGRQHGGKSRARGRWGAAEPQGASSPVHLLWSSSEDPQWEEVGWSKHPRRAEMTFLCPSSSSGIEAGNRGREADGDVRCDVLAAFFKKIRERW